MYISEKVILMKFSVFFIDLFGFCTFLINKIKSPASRCFVHSSACYNQLTHFSNMNASHPLMLSCRANGRLCFDQTVFLMIIKVVMKRWALRHLWFSLLYYINQFDNQL